MKNRDMWRPSKYVWKKNRLVASRDKDEVGVASRLMADLVASYYQANIGKYAKGRLLDLGCGKVPLYGLYREFVVDNICVDWIGTLHKNEYLDFECDLAKDLPFCDGEFDTVIASDALEHLPLPGNLWKEIYRVLSKGGKVILNVPFYYWIHERPYDYYRYTEFALTRFVEESGLALVKLESIGGSPEVLADILAKNMQVIPVIGTPLAILAQFIATTLVKTSFGKSMSDRTSKIFPYGYFLVAEKPLSG